MDHHIEIVQQDPLAVGGAFHVFGQRIGISLGGFLHKIAQSLHMRFGVSATNDEIVKKYVIDFLEVDADDVNTLLFYKCLNDKFFNFSLVIS